MKIIIVGCGKMGRYLSFILSKEKYDITVIDKNEDVLNNLNNNQDVSVVCGNGLVVDTLLEANVNESDILIASMKNDEDNILCCLLAKKLGIKSTIARVRNPEYTDSIGYIKEDLGLSMSINPELLTAKEISSTLKFQSNIKSTYLAKGKVELIEFKINEDSNLIDMSIKDLKESIKSNILIVAVERDNKVLVPNGDFIFKKDDKLVITAVPKDIMTFLHKIGENCIKANNVMIIGGSKVSYYLAKYLTDVNMKVKIIEMDKDKCEQLSDKLDKALIINGDGSDKQLLIEEGIENADIFIAATGIDEENVVFSMFANKIKVPKVITKINHLNFSEVLDDVGIDSIVTPHVVSSDLVLRYIRAKENSRGGSMETLIKLMNNNLEIMEFKMNDDFKEIGKQLKDIKFKNNLIIICINRKGKVIFPTGKDTIEDKDGVIVATTTSGIKGLNDILA